MSEGDPAILVPAAPVLAYYDTSALLKRLDPNEAGAATVAGRFALAGGPAYTSRLTRVEVLSGLRTKERTGAFTPAALAAARALFEVHARSDYAFLEVNTSLVASAERLVLAHKLRAYDAVHVAAALALLIVAGSAGRRLEFVTADADQGTAAQSEGLTVVRV